MYPKILADHHNRLYFIWKRPLYISKSNRALFSQSTVMILKYVQVIIMRRKIIYYLLTLKIMISMNIKI